VTEYWSTVQILGLLFELEPTRLQNYYIFELTPELDCECNASRTRPNDGNLSVDLIDFFSRAQIENH
jgi:hypothetical protein